MVVVLKKRRRLGWSARRPTEGEVGIEGGRRRCSFEGVGKGTEKELVGRS